MTRLIVTVVAVAYLQMIADAVLKIQWPKDLLLECAAKVVWMMFGSALTVAIVSARRYGK